MFTFLQRTPDAPALASHIRCAWLLSSDESAGTTMPIVPDGSVELVLNLGDPVDEIDGVTTRCQPRAMLVGQPTRPVVVRPRGEVRMVGVRLQPWASRAFVAAPAAGLSNQAIDVEAAGLHDVPALLDQLASATGDAARLDVLFAWLGRRAGSFRPRAPFVPAAVRAIRQRESLPSIRGLASDLGVTTRSLQRAFKEDVGMGPKTLQRITRLQRAIGLSRRNESLPWAAIAARSGYYDEAHLNLDFRDLAGCSPSQFAPRAESLTELMLESRGR